jgi:hypothetical protein
MLSSSDAANPRLAKSRVSPTFARHRYTFFNIDQRFPGAAAETSSQFVQGLRRVFHRRFCFPFAD